MFAKVTLIVLHYSVFSVFRLLVPVLLSVLAT